LRAGAGILRKGAVLRSYSPLPTMLIDSRPHHLPQPTTVPAKVTPAAHHCYKQRAVLFGRPQQPAAAARSALPGHRRASPSRPLASSEA
jgi:hypothetical protein